MSTVCECDHQHHYHCNYPFLHYLRHLVWLLKTWHGGAGQMLQSYPSMDGFSIHRLEILVATIYDFSTGLGKS